jgi:hypothetical protein
MSTPRIKPVRIAVGNEASGLTKEQKTFNRLIGQIQRRRATLAAWEVAIPAYQTRYARDLLPLAEESEDLQVRMVHCLDRASGQKALTKTERRLVSGLIVELAGELAAAREDAGLKEIYNRHSRSDFDREEAAAVEGMKAMVEEMLGLDLGDDEAITSPEDVLNRAKAHFEAEEAARQERSGRRKKSAKQIAREERQQAEAQQAGQSIREVYRKLASALHPDREADPRERERKTVLMQRVNEAYGKNNLLQLLELQLELEHIDQSAIDRIGADRLKHYNAVLKEQLGELDVEVARVEAGFRMQFGVSPFDPLSPDTVMHRVAREIADLERGIRELKHDLIAFEEIANLKRWLKEMRIRSRAVDLGGMPF